jgi:hypothetical protein
MEPEMTHRTFSKPTPDERAAFNLENRVGLLQAEIAAAEERVNAGFSEEVLPVFRVTVADWLEGLRADLLEAEVDLEFLRATIGAKQ